MLLQMEMLHFLMAAFYVFMYVCVYITTSVSICLLMRWLSCFRILAIVNKAAGSVYIFKLVLFFFFSGKYPEVKLLDHMKVLFLIF